MSTRYPLPYAWARAHQLLLEEGPEGRCLWFVQAGSAAEKSPVLWSAIGEVQRCHGRFELRAENASALQQRIGQAYAQQHAGTSAAAVASAVENETDLGRMMEELPAIEDLLESADDAPIIRLLNALLTQAARDGASDIHIEPYATHSSVRFRTDGELREVVQPHRALHAALISRLKIMAELDIAEKRLPQDGRIGLRLGERAIDVRVSTLPNAHGERAVLRLLDKSGGQLHLSSMGMPARTLDALSGLLQQPHGLLLVTGPTGSGKTTTLYAALQALDRQRLNVLTVEDPIEYELPGIGQTQVNPKIDLDFARALRAILRQDPDVVMIGEIRDFETAQIAIQASLTGHLVLATLHTNDSVSAVTRLQDMGIEPFLLASSLRGVLAQRLVRRFCRACQGRACPVCGESGYQGRTGVFELLCSDDTLRALIHRQAPEAELRAHAQTQGMRLLHEEGQSLVEAGITSAAEVLRVTRD